MASKNKDRRPPEPMVVVGFGKYELADLMGEDKMERLTEAFRKQWPPHYRRASACTPEEIELFKELTTLIMRETAKR